MAVGWAVPTDRAHRILRAVTPVPTDQPHLGEHGVTQYGAVDDGKPIPTDLRSFAFICGKKEFLTKGPHRTTGATPAP